MKTADRIAAVVLFGICTYGWFASGRFSPLSALFPRVTVLILGGLSLLLFILSFFRAPDEERFVLVHGNVLPVVLTVLMMVAWTVLISVVGFLVASLLMFSLMTIVLERKERTAKQIVLRILVTCAVTIGFYLFFDRLLLVSFPRGLLL